MKNFVLPICGDLGAPSALFLASFTPADLRRVQALRTLIALHDLTSLSVDEAQMQGGQRFLDPQEPEQANEELCQVYALGGSEGCEASDELARQLPGYQQQDAPLRVLSMSVSGDSVYFTVYYKHGDETYDTRAVTHADLFGESAAD